MGNWSTVTLPNAIAATRGRAEDIRERRNNAPEEWRIEGVDIFMLVVCEAAEQFNAQLKAAERRIMLLEEELKQSRYKLEAARAANDPATIQEYADYYSVAVQQFSVTGETPMAYSEWLADAQQANEGSS